MTTEHPYRLEQQPRQGGERGDQARRTPMRIWATIVTIVIGFAVGGLGLIVHRWWLIVLGVVLILGGGLAAHAFGIMENTE